MSPVLNLRLLRQTQFDSAAPSGTGIVVHRFETEGEYDLRVYRGEEVLQQVRVNVARGPGGDDDAHGRYAGGDPLAAASPPPGAAEAPAAPAVALDLTALLRPGAQAPTVGDVPSRGYLSITSAQPLPEHHVVVSTGDGRGEVLDTRRLGPRSLFAVTLVRPGRYRLSNAITGREAEVVVSYPKVGKVPYRPPAPLEIQCSSEGFGAHRFTISPAQGVIFRLATESRIKLELVEPDDGPQSGRSRPKAALRIPQARPRAK